MVYNLRAIDTKTNVKKPSWFRQTVSDLERHEGFRPYAYPDPLSKIGKAFPMHKYGWGNRPARQILTELGLSEVNGRPWTFGHGFTSRVTVDSVITKEQSLRRLEAEVIEHVKGLDKLVPKWEQAPLYAASTMANLIYNLGAEKLSAFGATLSLLNAGKYATAGHNLTKTLWYKQVGSRSRELTDRLITGKIAPEHAV